MNDTDRVLLEGMFSAAVTAAEPVAGMRDVLPEAPRGRVVVVGAGKGAGSMAAAFEELWDGPFEGVVVTRYGFGCETRAVRVIEAAHPVPDAAGIEASAALMGAVAGLGPDDLVVALICGGGSALLPSPVAGMELADEAELNRVLLASGAPIGAMNAIRKMVSGIKGGRLARAAHPARVVSLIVSDVPGDAAHEVASGPTVPGPGGRDEAMAAVARYGIELPGPVRAALEATGAPPDPEDAAFARDEVHVIASAQKSLEAAAQVAAEAGFATVILSDEMEGEARDVADIHAMVAHEMRRRAQKDGAPVAILSGGETTVTMQQEGAGGRGGRNSEFLLALALGLEGMEGVAAMAADTDGIDGSEDNAGAFADGQSAARMRAAGVDPAGALAGHDAWGAFDAVGDLFVPGPTGTNVNDLRVVLIR